MAFLSVFEVGEYLRLSLAHHCARVTIVTPGKFREAAETKEQNPLIKNIPMMIFLYISAYTKIKQIVVFRLTFLRPKGIP